jgi:hypothetical protein
MDFLHATATAMQKIVYSASLIHSFIRTMRFGISMKRSDNCSGNMKERVETNPEKTSIHPSAISYNSPPDNSLKADHPAPITVFLFPPFL